MIDRLYFLQSGEVELFLTFDKKHFIKAKKIKDMECFGQENFFNDKKSEYGARSVSVSNCLLLEKSDFLNIIKEFPQDYETYQTFKDSLNLFNASSSLDTQCPSCLKYDHYTIQSCPYVSFNTNKDIII